MRDATAADDGYFLSAVLLSLLLSRLACHRHSVFEFRGMFDNSNIAAHKRLSSMTYIPPRGTH